jgi:hypothetical protein
MQLALLASLATAHGERTRRSTSARTERQPEEEDEELLVALSISRVATQEANRNRIADAAVDRQQLHEAQRRSEREALAAEREIARKAELQSQNNERARAQTARANQEAVDKAIIASKAQSESDRRQKEQELSRLQVAYTVRDLSEDEQLQLAINQSRDEGHSRNAPSIRQYQEAMKRFNLERDRMVAPAAEPSATQRSEDRPVLGAIASYPPGPVTEQEQRSVADVQEPIGNPDLSSQSLSPIAEISDTRPASVRLVAGAYARGSSIVPATTTADHSRMNARPSRPLGTVPPLSVPEKSTTPIRPVSPTRLSSCHAREEGITRSVESFEVPFDISSESQISEDPRLYPGAYPPSPSQAGSVACSALAGSRSVVRTPSLPGAYPSSNATSAASRSIARSFSETPAPETVVAQRPWTNSRLCVNSSEPSVQDGDVESGPSRDTNEPRRSEQLPGAYPSSSQTSRAPSRQDTVSSRDTFFTAPEMQPTHRPAPSHSALSDPWNHRARGSQLHERPEPRPFTPLSSSSGPSVPSSAVRLRSSRTSHGTITRKPVPDSQRASSATAAHSVLATAADVASPSDLVSSGSQQGPVTINVYGPLTINMSESSAPSKSSLKNGITRCKKAFEQKGPGFHLKGISEATSAVLKKSSNLSQVRSSGTTGNAEASAAGEISSFPASQAWDDVGSVVSPLPATQKLHVTNRGPIRSHLSTPGTRPLQSEVPDEQSNDFATPRQPTFQRSVMSQIPARLQSRPTWAAPSTIAMILDRNGNAVTRPSDQQTGFPGSHDESSFMAGPTVPEALYSNPSLPQLPVNIRKEPPSVPRKPLGLTSPPAHPPPPPPPSRNPMTRHMLSGPGEQTAWLQQGVQFPIMNPTQGPTIGSPDSVTATPPTPQRANVELNRRSQFGQIDTDLANVPLGERRIDEFNSRSMMDLSRMVEVGNPASMEVLRRQYEETYARVPREQQKRQTSDARARKKEKDTQKLLREQR